MFVTAAPYMLPLTVGSNKEENSPLGMLSLLVVGVRWCFIGRRRHSLSLNRRRRMRLWKEKQSEDLVGRVLQII